MTGQVPTETNQFDQSHLIKLVGEDLLPSELAADRVDLDRQDLVIGRDPGVDLVIADSAISRRHARIARLGDDYLIEDLGSSNGTKVNDKQLTTRQVLQHGDVIDLGEAVRYRFEAPLPPEVLSPPEALSPPEVLSPLEVLSPPEATVEANIPDTQDDLSIRTIIGAAIVTPEGFVQAQPAAEAATVAEGLPVITGPEPQGALFVEAATVAEGLPVIPQPISEEVPFVEAATIAEGLSVIAASEESLRAPDAATLASPMPVFGSPAGSADQFQTMTTAFQPVDAPPTARPNPYVGPRSFETGETIYGRDRDIRQVFERLVAERIMVLHSPSGAGKSSLVRAGLVPRLGKGGYQVLPIIRVNQERPVDLLKQESTAIFAERFNRYIFSTLLSLDEGLPEEQRAALPHLAMTSLDQYLQSHKPAEGQPQKQVLIFDQFEEILTIAPTDLPGKQVFFKQLGEALQNPTIWALFLIREDFLGALDPYLRPVPTRLSNTYRLDLLAVDGARQAIQKPAGSLGVSFDDTAAQKLVDDLRAVQVQQLDGLMTQELGPYVEPVQLQVVCFRLWENLTPTENVIDETNLAAVGDVNQSLADYYSSTVLAASLHSGISERNIRQWFDQKLIVGGIRNQVVKGAESSGGLDNRAVQEMVNSHLVRAEQRAGATWYEMAHDRLIAPVQENNKAWYEKHLSLLQRQAALWEQSGRPDGLLLIGAALDEASEWAASKLKIKPSELERALSKPAVAGDSTSSALTRTEQDFLADCWAARSRRHRERTRNRIIAGLGIGALVLALVAGIAFIWALNAQQDADTQRKEAVRLAEVAQDSKKKAEEKGAAAVAAKADAEQQRYIADEALKKEKRQSELAQTNRLIALSQANRQELPQTSILLAADAYNLANQDSSGSQDSAVTRSRAHQALLDSLRSTSGRGLVGHEGFVFHAAFSPLGRWLATASKDGTIRIWDPQDTTAPPLVLEGHNEWINEIAFSPDGRYLASVSDDTTARLWDLENPGQSTELEGHEDWVGAVAFSPDGKWLATGSADDTVRIWNVADPTAAPAILIGHEGIVWDLVFSPDSQYLATGGYDAIVRLWNVPRAVSSPDSFPILLESPDEFIDVIKFSPDGKWLAAGDDNGVAWLWNMGDLNAIPIKLEGHDSYISTLAFSPDSQALATASGDKTIRLWNPNRPGNGATVLEGHEALVTGLAFTPDSAYLVSGSNDQTARLWDVNNPKNPLAVLRAHEGPINSLSLSPDGAWLATASDDKTARLWSIGENLQTNFLDFGSTPITIGPFDGRVREATFSPTGSLFAVASWDSSMQLWDRNNSTKGPVFATVDHYSWNDTLTFSRDGVYLADASFDGVPRIWTVTQMLSDPAASPLLLPAIPDDIITMKFSPDGRFLAVGGRDNNGYLYNLQDPTALPTALPGAEDNVYSVDFSPDSRLLVTLSDDGKTFIWDLDNLGGNPAVPLKTLLVHEGEGWQAAFSPGGHWLATGGDDINIHLYDVANLDTAPVLLNNEVSGVSALAFSPDDRYLATGTGGGSKLSSTEYTVKLWDAQEAYTQADYKPQVLSGHKADVRDLEFSPDGAYLVSSGGDGVILIWQPGVPGAEPLVLRGHTDEIWEVDFNAASSWLLSGSDDATARLWLIDPDELGLLSCQVASRNLSQDEWERYYGFDQEYREICP